MNGSEFVFSSCSDVSELIGVDAGDRDQLRLLLFNIGSARVSDGPVREDIEQLRVAFVDTPVVLLSDCEDVSCIFEAFRCGVRGFISTRLDSTVVVEALRLVQVGGTFFPADVLVKALGDGPQFMDENHQLTTIEPEALARLTPRQLEVLERLCLGMPNKLIAYDLKMQESTVKVHVRNIMKKLKAANRTQLALLAAHACSTNRTGAFAADHTASQTSEERAQVEPLRE